MWIKVRCRTLAHERWAAQLGGDHARAAAAKAGQSVTKIDAANNVCELISLKYVVGLHAYFDFGC